VQDAARLAGALQRAEVHVLKGAGHIGHEECCEEATDAMLRFFQQHVSSGQNERPSIL
jgi:pimeloyl-ACP methyl ester carboxylesterase